MSAQIDILKKVFEELTADLEVMESVGNRIYDYVPDNTAYPYIKIGPMESTDRGSETTDGWLNVVTVHVWHQTRSRKQILEIQDLIDKVLHNAEFNFSAETSNLSLRRDFSTVIDEPDTVTYHGVQRFTVLSGLIVST